MNLNVFNSRLARRIFTGFVACALIPVIVLAAVSLFQVSNQLENQAHQRLRRAAKSHGLSIFEHLLFCEEGLKLVGLHGAEESEHQLERFDAIGRFLPDGRYEAILGAPVPAVSLSDAQRVHLARGASLILISDDQPPLITLTHSFDAGDGGRGLLVGTLRGEYLWGIDKGNSLPPMTEFTVRDETGRSLYQSSGWPAGMHLVQEERPNDGLPVEQKVEDWFVAQWSLFLEPSFQTGLWSLTVLQPTEQVLAPVERFKFIFMLVVILALLLVVVLSLFNLRRSLGPIEALKVGARRIAGKDFDHRVSVDSRDEFEELAQSFNAMSSQLGRQFRILSTQAEIDQATLMARSFDHIAGLSITRVLKDFPFVLATICRIDGDDSDEGVIFLGHRSFPEAVTRQPFSIRSADLVRFNHRVPWVELSDPAVLSCYLPAELLSNLESAVVYPVFVKNRLFALLTVAVQPGMTRDEAMLALLRQITDHLAVAWSNVDLIRDLRGLTIGSMQALARAVDAKSPWTAGHSARVMRIAMGIGRQLGLSENRIDGMQQAALLHDIGKIGISSAILDKPGKLTDEEFATIRTHPVIGDKILSPIPAFKSIIPMVRHHHERWDGKGYPDGLAGEAIILEARILAVADVYDAIVSDRPYREGMPQSKALSIIEAEAGRQFDPEVVAAFMEVMQQKSALAA